VGDDHPVKKKARVEGLAEEGQVAEKGKGAVVVNFSVDCVYLKNKVEPLLRKVKVKVRREERWFSGRTLGG